MLHDAKYLICRKIDEPKRYFGLTLDEFIPIVLTILLCWISGSLLTGIFFAAIIWFVIKYFKKGQGTSWFFNLLYWYLPLHYLQGIIFQKTPPSAARQWLC